MKRFEPRLLDVNGIVGEESMWKWRKSRQTLWVWCGTIGVLLLCINAVSCRRHYSFHYDKDDFPEKIIPSPEREEDFLADKPYRNADMQLQVHPPEGWGLASAWQVLSYEKFLKQSLQEHLPFVLRVGFVDPTQQYYLFLYALSFNKDFNSAAEYLENFYTYLVKKNTQLNAALTPEKFRIRDLYYHRYQYTFTSVTMDNFLIERPFQAPVGLIFLYPSGELSEAQIEAVLQEVRYPS